MDWKRAGGRAARGACIAAAAAALAGCPAIRKAQQGIGNVRNAHMMEAPTGIGPAPGELRRSPCACLEVETDAYGRLQLG